MRVYLLAFLLLCRCQAAPRGELVTTAQGAVSAVANETRPRNVILITVDTLRADIIQPYGGPARTPVLQEWSEHGWLFSNCISAAMLTNPSHASIMTSLYPRDHGVYDNESGIGDGVRTLAFALRQQGMRTAAVVNFPHLNPEVANLGQGFEKLARATRNERRGREVTAEALRMVDNFGSDERFFMWLHYTDPHAPYEPEGFSGLTTDAQFSKLPMALAKNVAPGFQKNNPWFATAFKRFATTDLLAQRYVAEVEATDAALGDLWAGLKNRKRADDTMLIVTADHGENLGEHALFFHHGGLYRSTVHVPLLVFFQGLAAKKISTLVETVDIAPTILDVLNQPRWEPMRGKSLLTTVQTGVPVRDVAFSEHMFGQLVAVRSETSAVILHRKSAKLFPNYPFTEGRREYFDIHDNQEGAVQSLPEMEQRRLATALDNYLGTSRNSQPKKATQQDRASLRALGYVE